MTKMTTPFSTQVCAYMPAVQCAACATGRPDSRVVSNSLVCHFHHCTCTLYPHTRRLVPELAARTEHGTTLHRVAIASHSAMELRLAPFEIIKRESLRCSDPTHSTAMASHIVKLRHSFVSLSGPPSCGQGSCCALVHRTAGTP